MATSGEVPVSVCTHRQPQNEKTKLVMMENVERVSACLSFSQDVGQYFPQRSLQMCLFHLKSPLLLCNHVLRNTQFMCTDLTLFFVTLGHF